MPGPHPAVDSDTTAGAAVVVPVKPFDTAKGRLAGVLDAASRAVLARSMAERVLSAAAPLHVAVVCEDDAVAAWARDRGAEVVRSPGRGLNGAVSTGVAAMAGHGFTRVVVAHADLPFADRFRDLLTLVTVAGADALFVPDRHGDGTNVAVIPTVGGFRFAYGPRSFTSHQVEARRLGWRVVVEESDALGWDIDRPEDLHPPGHLGAIPGLPVTGAPT